MTTQKQAWSGALKGFLTSVAILLMVGAFFGVLIAVGSPFGKTEVERKSWTGTWVHTSDTETSVIRLDADGSIAASNVPPAAVDTVWRFDEPGEIDWGAARDLNGCWDPFTEKDDGEPATFSVRLLGPNDWNDGDISTSLYVKNNDTLFFEWGPTLNRQKLVYERWTGAELSVPDADPGVDTCFADYWVRW